MDEGGGEWEEPQERKKDGETSDDLGIDHALLLALADGVAGLVKVLSSDTGDNGGKGQLVLKSVIAVDRYTNDARLSRECENIPGRCVEPFRECDRLPSWSI